MPRSLSDSLPLPAFILFRSAFIEQKNGKEITSKQQNLSHLTALEVKRKTRKPTTELQVEEGSCKWTTDLITSGIQGDDLVAAVKSEGVAPFARAECRHRNNTQSQPTPVDMTLTNGSVGMTPSFIPPHGMLGDKATELDVGVGHYPPASLDFDYLCTPSPKF